MTMVRVQSLCSSDDIRDDYRRRARRLRHTLRNDPSRLHRSLARLAGEFDDRPAAPANSSVLSASPAARRFELIVREQSSDAPMRYSQRQALLKTASAMGLGRFEANLILAIEQNRHPPAPTKPSRLGALLPVALLQTLILIGAWWIFVR